MSSHELHVIIKLIDRHRGKQRALFTRVYYSQMLVLFFYLSITIYQLPQKNRYEKTYHLIQFLRSNYFKI